jgi:hypothetical protein
MYSDEDQIQIYSAPLEQLALLEDLTMREDYVDLPAGLSDLTKLTSLTLDTKGIFGVTPALRRLPRLCRVACKYQIAMADQVVRMLRGATAITSLSVEPHAAGQSALPSTIATLTGLRELSFSLRDAGYSQADMIGLSRLTSLTISGYNVEERLPEQFTVLPQLRVLRLPPSIKLSEHVTRLRRLERVVGSREHLDDIEHRLAVPQLLEMRVRLSLGTTTEEDVDGDVDEPW